VELSAEVTAALPLLMRVAEKQIRAWMDAPGMDAPGGEHRKDAREAEQPSQSEFPAISS
jgi:hypothetical protein